ncbi:unnamed protein product [Ilex paraguariensis]|uniref:Uncharacterized protein n=1 Tax=Ilex paraguariensis TaxID=185542 RepID=A0ABC8STS7_9AQUA
MNRTVSSAMYRSAAMRLLGYPSLYRNEPSQTSNIRALVVNPPRFSASATSEAFLRQSPNQSDSASSSSWTEEERARGYQSQSSKGRGPKA